MTRPLVFYSISVNDCTQKNATQVIQKHISIKKTINFEGFQLIRILNSLGLYETQGREVENTSGGLKM